MSIANKLIYLNGTKEKLKESINNIGGSITNETTFRAYAEELDNIYSNIPKTTGEGSNLSLTTIKGRINVDDILGDTEQEGTPTPSTPIDIEVVTGQQEVLVQNINFLPSVNTTRTINGVTFTHNADGTILVNGTATANALYPISLDGTTETTNVSLLAGTYVVTDGVGDYTNYFTQVSDRNQYMNTGSSGTTGISPTVTFSTNVKVYARIFVREGKTVSNKLFKPMIVKSTDVSAPYTPYQEQTKTLHLSSKNLFDNSADTTSLIKARCSVSYSNNKIIMSTTGADAYWGNITTTGTAYSSDKGQLIQVNSNTKYTFSITNTSIVKNFVVYYDESKTSLGYAQMNSATYTFTTPATCKYVSFRIGYNDSISGGTYEFNIQLEKSEQATTYEPYYNYELSKIGTYQDRISKSSGKQLWNLSNGTYSASGITAVVNNGVIVLSGTASSNAFIGIPLSNTITWENKNYTIGANNSVANSNVKLRVNSGGQLDTTLSSVEATSTINGTAQSDMLGTSITIRVQSGATLSNFIIKPMLVEGSTALPYEPYGSDKWYIEKNIGKANLSSFTWNAYPTAITNISRFATMQIPNVKYVTTNTELGNALATHYVLHTGNGLSTVAYNFCIDVSMVQATDDSTLTTPRGEMYYALATPTYTEITNETLKTELNEIEKMMSYNGQTNISISGNLPMILNVSALKGE